MPAFSAARFLLLLLGILPSATPSATRPDIILIVTDDQRFDSMQFMPFTDSLIGAQGVRFTRAFASTPLCCPSRATLLTGLYSHHHGVLSNVPPLGGAPAFHDASTLATWLHAAGYRTALLGKYLNAYNKIRPWPYVPPGWSYWRAMAHAYYYDFDIVTDTGRIIPYRGTSGPVYSTNVIADLALDAIRATPADKPLFLYFAPYGPHGPATPAPRDKNTFSGLPPVRPPSFDEADVSDKPAWVRALPRLTADKKDYLDFLHRRQAEALQSVDRAVRDIVAALDAAGRLDRSVLIFVSDNGLTLGEHRWAHEKNCVYEECIRVPLQVRAPGVTPRFDGHLISTVDLAPTIADFAGVTPPIPLDGRSFKPLLVNPGVAWRDGLLIEVLGLDATMNQQAVRTKDYVYAEYQNGDRELYDLAVDPFQLENVVDDPAYASVRAALRAQLNALRAE